MIGVYQAHCPSPVPSGGSGTRRAGARVSALGGSEGGGSRGNRPSGSNPARRTSDHTRSRHSSENDTPIPQEADNQRGVGMIP